MDTSASNILFFKFDILFVKFDTLSSTLPEASSASSIVLLSCALNFPMFDMT